MIFVKNKFTFKHNALGVFNVYTIDPQVQVNACSDILMRKKFEYKSEDIQYIP